MRNKFFLILFSIALFSACSNNHYYEENAPIPQEAWNVTQAVVFSAQINDINKFYNLKINISHKNNYEYNNLWLFIKTTSPSGKMQIDTMNCILTDYNHYWIGKCKKDNCKLTVNFADSVKFIEPGLYEFEIIQGLRQDIIQNITEIGFIIDQITEK
ncbi:MAG: gliding motility lipoprotein GldH [Bacteroidales bacterium]|nr:gliding motility lipoprotein GldH [Bacteroidales bacterium]